MTLFGYTLIKTKELNALEDRIGTERAKAFEEVWKWASNKRSSEFGPLVAFTKEGHIASETFLSVMGFVASKKNVETNAISVRNYRPQNKHLLKFKQILKILKE